MGEEIDFFDMVRHRPAWVVRRAIRKGSDPNARNRHGTSSLMVAACRNAGIVRTLLEAGCDPNARDNGGITPLMVAALYSPSPAVTTALLKAGASVSARDKHGRTPLMYAAVSDHPWAVSLLLDHGTDLEARDDDGKTPLLLAAEAAIDARTIERLLKSGSDINVRDGCGMSALHLAAHNSSQLPAIAFMLAHAPGAAEEIASWSEGLLESMPRSKTAVEVITTLLEGGAEVNSRNDDGQTALMLAARPLGWPEALLAFETAGISITKPYRDGVTPLSLMEKGAGSQTVIAALLAAGANVGARDNQGMNALHYTVREGGCGFRTGATEVDIVWPEKEHFFGLLRVPGGTEHRKTGDDRTVIRVLLDAGIDIESRDRRGRTALMLAASEGSGFAQVAALLVAGADRSARDAEGRTALEYATRSEIRAAFGAITDRRQPSARDSGNTRK